MKGGSLLRGGPQERVALDSVARGQAGEGPPRIRLHDPPREQKLVQQVRRAIKVEDDVELAHLHTQSALSQSALYVAKVAVEELDVPVDRFERQEDIVSGVDARGKPQAAVLFEDHPHSVYISHRFVPVESSWMKQGEDDWEAIRARTAERISWRAGMRTPWYHRAIRTFPSRLISRTKRNYTP